MRLCVLGLLGARRSTAFASRGAGFLDGGGGGALLALGAGRRLCVAGLGASGGCHCGCWGFGGVGGVVGEVGEMVLSRSGDGRKLPAAVEMVD